MYRYNLFGTPAKSRGFHVQKRAAGRIGLLLLLLDCKSGKPLSDFPHNAVGNNPLRFTIPEYGFSVMECYLHHSFHVKGNGAE